MSTRSLCLLTGLLALGCTASRVQPHPDEGHALPFIEDDYRKAVAEARERRLPILVDAWAPW